MRSFALACTAVALMAPGSSGFQGAIPILQSQCQSGKQVGSMTCDRGVGNLRMNENVAKEGEQRLVIGRRDMLVRTGLAPLILGASFPRNSFADMTLNSFKRAYFRYAPRIEEGRDFFVLEVRSLIEKGEWDKIASLYELTSVAQV